MAQNNNETAASFPEDNQTSSKAGAAKDSGGNKANKKNKINSEKLRYEHADEIYE